ncbi:MAG: hypothetical protein EXS36_14770 [Pedosphaera sp.]|nr:hypothetical protein [Pedosphaera sp.]
MQQKVAETNQTPTQFAEKLIATTEEADVTEIHRLRADPPDWPRYQLSLALAGRWQWRNEAG